MKTKQILFKLLAWTEWQLPSNEGTLRHYLYRRVATSDTVLPMYINVGNLKLAVWNCGTPGYKGLRITLRDKKNGLWLATIKQGDDHIDTNKMTEEFHTSHPILSFLLLGTTKFHHKEIED